MTHKDYHGTTSGYSYHKCRCNKCVTTWNEYHVKTRAARQERNVARSNELVHGLAKTYYKGCRCSPCKSARAVVYAEQRAKSNAAFMATDPSTWEHGVETYRKGCRCDICRAAHSAKGRHQNYGLSDSDYMSLAIAQGFRCAICEKSEEQLGRPLFVDHDHSTGAVRGLLCSLCNTGIGSLGDSADILSRAAEYLRSA